MLTRGPQIATAFVKKSGIRATKLENFRGRLAESRATRPRETSRRKVFAPAMRSVPLIVTIMWNEDIWPRPRSTDCVTTLTVSRSTAIRTAVPDTSPQHAYASLCEQQQIGLKPGGARF
jgi:hypothetical protein